MPSSRLLASLLLAAPFSVSSFSPLPAQTPSPAPAASDAADTTPSDFVRFVRVGDGGHFDTAITTYERDGVTLLLFGAVHIADAACYAALNDRFTQCDVLLYELVAPADTRPTRNQEERGFNPLSMLQQGLKTSMELAFQLDEIDYQAANFVHADMTPAEFERSMAERGESILSIMWNMMANGMRLQREQAEQAAEGARDSAPPPVDLVKAFRTGEGRHALRMQFASQLEAIELMSAGGKGSTLLEGRNEKCLEVLDRVVREGKKRIGIYYGAAHLPHMEQRLVGDLGWKKIGHEWLVAWDCTKRPDVKYDRELSKLRRRCRDDLAALAAAAKQYRVAHGNEPVPTVQQLVTARPTAEPGAEAAWTGPVNDPWGNAYVVRKRPTGARWEAASGGQDGVLGTADDLTATEPRAGGLKLFGR